MTSETPVTDSMQKAAENIKPGTVVVPVFLAREFEREITRLLDIIKDMRTKESK